MRQLSFLPPFPGGGLLEQAFGLAHLLKLFGKIVESYLLLGKDFPRG